MEIALFAKKITMKNGKTFYKFLSSLTNKNGETQGVRVMFASGCVAPKPSDCPMNIIIEKGDCNLSKKRYVDKNNFEKIAYTLWVDEYSLGSPYEDNSMDDYDM